MRNQRFIITALAIALLVTMAACGTQTTTPSTVQVNGYVVERDASGLPTGRVDLGISAFDLGGTIVPTAEIRSVSATVDAVTTSAARSDVTVTQTYSVQGDVCGDIEATAGLLVSVLMIDETGSMNWEDPAGERFTAAKAFVNEMGSDDVAAIARFSTSATTSPGLINAEIVQTFTSDTTVLEQAIDQTFLESGATPLWDAAHDAVTILQPRSEVNRVAIILTDGQDTGSTVSVAQANQLARDEGVAVYALGFGAAVPADLDALVAGTGGYRDNIAAGGDRAVQNLLDNIFAATQAQGCVQLTFSPPPPAGLNISGTVTIDFDEGSADSGYDISF